MNAANHECDRPRHECERPTPEHENQRHVHELSGSTAVFTKCCECHNHRFCTVTGEAMRMGNSHVHEVKFRTDFDDKHYHEFKGQTGPAYEVGEGKHVHYIKDFTQERDGHKHRFQAATFIDSPLEFKQCD